MNKGFKEYKVPFLFCLVFLVYSIYAQCTFIFRIEDVQQQNALLATSWMTTTSVLGGILILIITKMAEKNESIKQKIDNN